jgi:hypothetical protein
MRSMLTVFPVRRTTIPKTRRKRDGESFGKMLSKLESASSRLKRARSRR